VKKRFFDRAIAAVLQQSHSGRPGCRCLPAGRDFAAQFYRWKKEYGNLQPSEAREPKQLRDENTNLKRTVADKIMRQDVLQKKF